MPKVEALRARAEKHGRLAGMLAVALALLAVYGPTLIGHVRLAADAWTFSDDARVLIHPQFRDEDPTLFPGDPAVDYMLASLPDGYALLYRTLGPICGVAALSKILPYVLFALTLACLATVAFRLGGMAAVCGSLALALGSAYVLGRMVGGLPRAFALPFMAAGALCLVRGHARALALLALVAAGFYPVAALTLGVALALLLVMPAAQRGSAQTWSLPRRAALLVGTAGTCVIVLLPSLTRLRAWGEAIGPRLVAAYPEAGAFGRFDPMDRPPFPALPRAAFGPLGAALVGDGEPLVKLLDARAQASWLVPLLAVCGLLGCAWRARRHLEARRFLLLPLAVVLCHTAALVLEPRLFLPERYVAYAVPAVALLAVPCALGALRESKRHWVRITPWVYNVLLVLLLGARGVTWSGFTIHVPPAERGLHAFIAKLPRTAVVAGFPSETNDSIPYLTRRSVFLARETHMPFHTRYTELMRARATALFHAYFAGDQQSLRAFRDREHVTHLLLDRRNFETRPWYFAPFDAQIGADFATGRAHGFAALTLPPELRVFEAGPFVLLDLRKR